MEPPDAGCYGFEMARCAMESFCSVQPGKISWPLTQRSKTSTVVGSGDTPFNSPTNPSRVEYPRCDTRRPAQKGRRFFPQDAGPHDLGFESESASRLPAAHSMDETDVSEPRCYSI